MTYALVFGYILLANNMTVEQCTDARVAFRNLVITSGVPITSHTLLKLKCEMEYTS